MSELRLIIDGASYAGWLSVSVVRSLEQLVGTFSVAVAERWSHDAEPLPIREGAAVEVRIDDEVVITGWVDDVGLEHDLESRAITIAGRSKTGDLVDCSVIRKGGQWKRRTLRQIAEDVCAPFGVKVVLPVNVILGGLEVDKPFRVFAVEEGESAHDLLERAARMRGVLLVTTAAGDLEISRPAGAPIATALVSGENILKASREGSWRERFSRYVVKAQAPGDDESFGKAAAAKSSAVDDARVDRYRPLVLMAEEPNERLETRAEWERNVRFGRSLRVNCSVQGWRHAGGLWAPNQRVRVRDRFLHVDAEMLLVGVTLTLSDQGERAELSFVRPEAFSDRDLPLPRAEGQDWYKAPARAWVPQ